MIDCFPRGQIWRPLGYFAIDDYSAYHEFDNELAVPCHIVVKPKEPQRTKRGPVLRDVGSIRGRAIVLHRVRVPLSHTCRTLHL